MTKHTPNNKGSFRIWSMSMFRISAAHGIKCEPIRENATNKWEVELFPNLRNVNVSAIGISDEMPTILHDPNIHQTENTTFSL